MNLYVVSDLNTSLLSWVNFYMMHKSNNLYDKPHKRDRQHSIFFQRQLHTQARS